jgi:hypothetical protein
VSTPGTRNTVTPADAARADEMLRALRQAATSGEWRGLLVAAFADCRHDAYADALADYRAASTEPAPGPYTAAAIVTPPTEVKVDGRGRWERNPGDLPPAVADALTRCPTCGTPWPEDVDPQERTDCDPR